MAGHPRHRHAHRRGRIRRRALGGAAVAAALVAGLVTVLAPASQADQSTAAFNNLRTGWDASESGLSPAAVESSTFGQLFKTALNPGEQVYAQPLVVGNTVIAVTESNNAYGINGTTGAILWKRNYGAPWPSSAIGCGDLAPNIGATATPVYDPSSNALYFTTKVDDGTTTHLHPRYLMHAVDPASGAERTGWPVTIQGTPANEPSAPFNPYYEMQRPGLLLLDGVVYAGFGGHCDHDPYRGYVVGVGTASHAITSMWASETGASTSGAGIWQAGGGLVSDGSGRIFFSTGNGISPTAGPGSTPPGTLAESVVRLQVDPTTKALSTADFFSPANASTLDLTDKDISSGGPMGLPDGYGSTAHPHLMVAQGKDGRVFLLDRDKLGGQAQGAGGTDAVVGVAGPYQGQWGHPAFWGGDGGYVYVIGNGGPLRALHLGSVNGTPALTLTGQSQDTFGYTTGSPTVTSTGTNDGSALVWLVSADGATGANGTLRAFSATPDGKGLLQQLWSAPIGTAAKFATPTANNGKIYVGTRDGYLYGFGSPATTALKANPLDFGQVQVGTTATATMKLTATKAVTVKSVTATAPFSVPQLTAAKAVAVGGTLPLSVGYLPSATGGANGTLTAVLSDGSKLVFSLHGVGTNPGLAALPSSLAFGEVPTGTDESLNVQITNTGTATETISSVTAPGSGSVFQVSGLPAAGTPILAGNSFVASVDYTPAKGSTAPDSDSIVVQTTSEHSVTVPLTGTPITGRGHLTFSPASLNFGTVPVGSSKTLTFGITNDGNMPVTITKAKAPNGDYTSPNQLSEGLVIGPGQTAKQAVTYTPTSSAVPAQPPFYEVTSDATDYGTTPEPTPQGAMEETLTGVGVGVADTTAATAATWRANGAASLPGDGSITLNPARGYQAGSAVYTRPLRTQGLRATFTVKLGPGTGGDGMAFSLLDPNAVDTSALGARGAGLGMAGMPALVVGLDAAPYAPVTRIGNFVGLATSTPGSTTLNYVSTTGLATSLRQGTHQVDVQVTGGHVLVSIDGVQRLNAAATLPDSAYVAFSGGTGSLYDAHTVQNFVIAGGPAPSALGWTPVTQTRVLATWAGLGRPGTAPVPAGGTVSVPVTGRNGVPANAAAVVLEVGAANPVRAGSITAWPHGAAKPNAPGVYWNGAGQTVEKTVVVRPGLGGMVDFANNSSAGTGMFADVVGYYAPGTGQLLTPTKQVVAFDTARAIGQPTTAPLRAGGTAVVSLAGKVPANATSVVLSLTVARSASSGSAVVWGYGANMPNAASVYWTGNGDAGSNLVTVPLGKGGRIDVHNWSASPIVMNAVVQGYAVPGSGAHFVPTAPFPLVNANPLAAKGIAAATVAGRAGVPADATAVVLRLTATGGTAAGSLTAWGAASAAPGNAAVFWNVGGHVVSNLVVVPLDGSGAVDVRNSSTAPARTQATVVGYYTG